MEHEIVIAREQREKAEADASVARFAAGAENGAGASHDGAVAGSVSDGGSGSSRSKSGSGSRSGHGSGLPVEREDSSNDHGRSKMTVSDIDGAGGVDLASLAVDTASATPASGMHVPA